MEKILEDMLDKILDFIPRTRANNKTKSKTKSETEEKNTFPKDMLISDKAPGLEIWQNLKSFEVLDYLTFAESVHELDRIGKTKRLINPLPVVDKDGEAIPLTEEFVTYKRMIKQSAEKFRKSSMKLIPYGALGGKDDEDEYGQEKGGRKKSDKRRVMEVMEIFWSVPKLLPYASMMTILAIINGIPGEFFSGDYLEFESDGDNTGKLSMELTFDKSDEEYRKSFCNGLRVIIRKWKTSKKCDRSTKYRNKLPFYSYETMKRDFWLMIFFMKMQQELANYMEKSGNPDGIDLSYLYEAFLSIWPYSPQLFFNIDSKEKNPKIWKGKLDYFFKEPDMDGLIEGINKSSKLFISDGSMEHRLGTMTLSGYYCLVDSGQYPTPKDVRKKVGNNWLIPYTPYFAAYYFVDDFRLYGMLHCGKEGETYRKRICEILIQKSEPYRKLIEEILLPRLRIALSKIPQPKKKELLEKYNIPSRLGDFKEEGVDREDFAENEKEVDQICKDWLFELVKLAKKILEEKDQNSSDENVKSQNTINSYIDDPYFKMVLGGYFCIISTNPFVYIKMPPLRVAQEIFMRHKTQDSSNT